MPPPEIPTCTLHYTQTPHQNISKPGIRTPWIIYLQTPTTWYTINFHEQAILESRLSSNSNSISKASRRELYDFQLRELRSAPQIYERCPDSDNGEAMVTRRVKEFGIVEGSVGMRRLLKEFGERVRRGEIPVDELFLPPFFLLWLESLNLKPPKTKKSKSKSNPKTQPQTEIPLSSNPNFKILLQVSKIQPSNSQESWIWNETRTLLKLTNRSGPNKSGLYIIPNPYPSCTSPAKNPILFSWTHGSLTTRDNTLYAHGKCLTFSPPSQHSSTPPPPVHFHPLPKNSLTPSPHFAASINRSHFSKHWEEYEVDINQPAIPCVWWEKNITILEDGVLLREYEELYERSKEKGGPQFTPSTFLAQIFHTINTSIPPSKKRGSKNKSPNDNNENLSIDISELYERGRQDLARSNRHMYCLKALALSSSSSNIPLPPRSQSLPTRTGTGILREKNRRQGFHRDSSQRRNNHESFELRSRSTSNSTTKSTHELKNSPSSSLFSSQSLNPNNRSHKFHSTRTHSVPPPPPPSRSSTSSSCSNSSSSSNPTTNPKQRQSSLERSDSKPKTKSAPQSEHRNPLDALRKTQKLFKKLPASCAD
ncbi:hypothetical protein BCON_0050g00040 [Botryotinia convoluta]|uniref:Uncharacterized protein n=1 Tax=Botryotinia convoluta TaxID=54673 RepID=A0A4Z1IQ63_9HELO|nr:hypothetical protein BCON_0050g00040 [Botryotinia convoluta]